MPDLIKNGPAPFSIRLTQLEREQLEKRAAGQPLGTYIRAQIFRKSESDFSFPLGRKALAQILGKLGQSELSKSLAILAETARLGILPVTSETEDALLAAARDVHAMKEMLMKALRTKER
jgi:hypothetical protein